MSKLRWSFAGGMVLALAGLIVLASAPDSRAGEDNKELVDALHKIAAAAKDGDKDAATKAGSAIAKKFESPEDYMHMFKTRKKGGLGVGKKAGVASKDGIELMLVTIGRDVPTATQMNKEAEMIEDMAYHIIAMGEISKHFPPKKDKGQANKRNWNKWNSDMMEAAGALAKAAAKKGAGEVKTAASKVNTACNTCHSTFK